MVTAAPKPCTHMMCGALVYDGSSRCAKHKQAERKGFDKYRGSARKRGYTWAWEKARKAYLSQPENVLCVRCRDQNIIKEAEVVDHITPHKGDQQLFWDKKNWQPLCKVCHDKKTAKEDVGFGRIKGHT